MKQNPLKVLALTCLAVLGALAAPRGARAAVPPEQIAAFYDTKSNADVRTGGTVPTVSLATTTTLMNLFYNGPSTAAYVSFITGGSNSGLCAVFYAPFNVVDTSVGSATCGQTGGAFDLGASTYNTLGAFADAVNVAGLINGLPRYHAILTGGVRSDSTLYLPTVNEASGTNNIGAVGGFTVPIGTQTIISLDIQPAPSRYVTLNYCTVNAAGTPNVQVFGVKAKFGAGKTLFGGVANDSSQIWVSPALTANTSTSLPTFQAASSAVTPNFPWLEFAPAPAVLGAGPQNQYNQVTGNTYSGHVVVRVNNYGLGAANFTSSNFLSCQWTESTN